MLEIPCDKIGIVGDIHLGIKSDSSEFHEAHEQLYKFIEEQFLARGVKYIIKLGDLFHNRNEINVKTLSLAKRLEDAESKFFTKFLLVGNHDTYYKNSIDVSGLTIFEGTPSMHIIFKPTVVKWGNKKLLIVPWIIDNDEFIRDYINGCDYDYIFGHFEFKGGQLTKSHVNYSSGLDYGDLMPALRPDGKIISGHFHLKRWLTKSVLYAGTPMQLNWGDSNEEKSIYVLDKAGEIEEIRNTVSPIFESFTLSELKANPKSYKIRNNYVRIYIDKPIDELKLQQLTDLIRSRNPKSLSILDYTYTPDLKFEVQKFKDPIELVKEYVSTLSLPEGIAADNVNQLIDHYYREAVTQ